MKKTLFTGSAVALITPFGEKGVNFDALGKLIDFHLENDTDALVVCGTTGEPSTMNDTEHISVIEYAAKKVGGKIPVIAGTGSNDTRHGVALCKSAQDVGADGLLLVTPYYNKTNTTGLIKHYTAMAESVDIPIILYNVPSRTGMGISLDVIKEVADIDNIVAIKEASGNISFAAEIAARFPELDLYSGNDDMTVPIMSLGGKGVISVVANILPKDTHDMCKCFLEGNIKEATRYQLKMLKLINSLFCEVNPIPVKTALGMMGMDVGHLRLPLWEMEEGHKAQLKQAMIDYGIKL